LLLVASTAVCARAADGDGGTPGAVATVAPAAAPQLAPAPVTITLVSGAHEATYTTEAKTFGDFLAEQQIHVGENDYLSDDPATPLVDGMHLAYRAAVPLTIVYGKHKISLQTSAATVAEAIADAHIAIGPRDSISRDRRAMPQAGDVIRVTFVKVWLEHVRHAIANRTILRDDARLASGKTRVVARGTTGIREVTLRCTRRGNAAVRKVAIGSRVLRSPHARIVERGTLVVTSLANPIGGFARKGFASAMHFAGTVLHVIATAYIAGCYKCSGTTANGMHAGFGIIAVDPRLIPLGTKLMIPGYGRAIAGDTGGAIIGHRVDLGMNTLAAALKFGRRPMTVYVLK
jgi:3D (Asp-Asp-Asp) domain-containing protein/uncharacterized protein YabE (DUF348 family)